MVCVNEITSSASRVGQTKGPSYILRGRVPLKIRLDRLVLLVELGEVGHEVLDDEGMWERVDLHVGAALGGDAACCRQLSAAGMRRMVLLPGPNQHHHIHKQARVLVPLMFMAQLPQMPSLQLRRKVRVGSSSFLMRIRASRTMGPVLLRSRV